MLIVAETCPAPEGNLLSRDVERLVADLAAYHALFAPLFCRSDQADWAAHYLQGLLGDCPRTSIEPMALALGLNVRTMQHFIGQSTWATAPLVAAHQALVATTLGEADGVILVDESGVVKQGTDSAGVGYQYCGSVGKVANCQVGVYLGYASRNGYTLLDGQLFVPEPWFDAAHAALRTTVGLPTALVFQTKPVIALALLTAMLERDSLPARWLVADALYGDSPAFRDGVAGLGLWYFTAVACSTLIWRHHPALIVPVGSGKGRKPTCQHLKTPTNQPYRVDTLLQRLPKTAWIRAIIKEGSKGPIVCDIACLRVTDARKGLPGLRQWLVLRRNVLEPSVVKYYLCNAPAESSVGALVRMCGMRWPVELCFEESKGEIGLDHAETRSWVGWHHHIALVLLAHHFLVWTRVRWQALAPALTLYQVRLLLISVLPKPVFDAARALAIICYYQRHNHAAYVSHRKRKLTQLAARGDLAL